MSNLKFKPILLTALATAVVLFGGWAIYQQVAVQAPLEQAIKDVQGIVHADKPKRDSDWIEINVELAPTANLREVYETIAHNGERVIGNRTLKLQIDSEANAQLEGIWQSAMFQIAEAMENKTYSQIPTALEQIASKYNNVKVNTDIDDNNVYITLTNNEGALHKVLPRTPHLLGAWSNA